ncbi:hypothetical protein C8Q76DRAFT_476597 [Earliella scabrosa]|nr:hypothetical protein C8Q76DRAFT_476597 [Earliella scabrosa]
MSRRRTTNKNKTKCPLRIRVQRTTAVNANNGGFTLGSLYQRAKQEAVRSFTRSEGSSSTTLSEPDRSYLFSAQSIGHGVVHNASRGPGSVVWSGAIIIPPARPGFTGGFEASGLQVTDTIVLSIDAPSLPSGRQYAPVRESIPIRLTTDPAKSHMGVVRQG